MSTVDGSGQKVILGRNGAGQFWDDLREQFAANNPRRLKALAILVLRENSGWTLEQIGEIFGHPRGHVARLLAQVKEELRSVLSVSDGFFDPDAPIGSAPTDHETSRPGELTETADWSNRACPARSRSGRAAASRRGACRD